MARKTPLVFRAFLLTLLLNLPYLLVIHRHSSGLTLSAFNDLDEALYTRAAIDQGNFYPAEAVYFEHAKPVGFWDLLTRWRPDQTFSHFLLGFGAQKIGLGVVGLGTALDLICVFACYIIFSLSFVKLLGANRQLLAEIASLVLLALPWIGNIEEKIELHPLLPEITGVLNHASHTCLPVQEGVEAQLAMIFFGLVLYVTFSCHNRDYSRLRQLWGLGTLCGTLIYIYVLAWMAVSSLVVLMVLFDVMFNRSIESIFRRVIFAMRCALPICIGNLITASLGIVQIFNLRESGELFAESKAVFSSLFYTPIEWIAVLLFVFLLLARRAVSRVSEIRFLLCGGASVIVSDFILHNIQPLTGAATASVFFSITITRPFWASLITILLFVSLSRKPSLRPLFLALLCSLTAVATLQRFAYSNIQQEEEGRFDQLVEFIDRELPKKSVLAMLTFEKPFSTNTREWNWRWQPNGIAAITGNHLLKESIGFEWGWLGPKENITRELALANIFTGRAQLLRPCINEIEVLSPMMFFQQWIAIQLSRINSCKQAATIIDSYTSCQAIRDYKVDYVIWEKSFSLPLPEYLVESAKLIWTSGEQTFAVYRLNQADAVKYFCEDREAEKVLDPRQEYGS